MEEEQIKRKAIVTLEGGAKILMELTIKPEAGNAMRFIDDFERKFVKNFNAGQPNLKNKVIKCHILRK